MCRPPPGHIRKAIEEKFQKVLFVSVNETVQCDHSNETHRLGLSSPAKDRAIKTPAVSKTIQILTPERLWGPLAFDRV